jgi:hypothetical protein
MPSENETNLAAQALLESYKIVSTEIQLFLKEKIKCFLYAAILMALYLGVGIGKDAEVLQKVSNYLPLGFIMLIAYFLILQYISMVLIQYRGSLEMRINKLLGQSLIDLDSRVTKDTQRYGYLKKGGRALTKIPSPSLFFGLIAAIIVFIIFIDIELIKIPALKFLLLGLCSIMAIYVFFIFPKFLEKKIHDGEQITEN